MKIIDIIFVDMEKTAVKITKEDGAVEVVNFDHNREDLEKQEWSEYEIERNTLEFHKKEKAARDGYEKYLNGVHVLGDAKSLLTRDFTIDELFEMKLAAFELEEVKSSTDRTIKVALRKAKDIFELFHYIHELRNQSEK